ncbi:YdeI family protein [Chloroflexota bacterium]
MPPDLRNALIIDTDAWGNFQRFAHSHKNNYIGWINAAKTEQTRKRRIAEVVKRSLMNKKPGEV